jgi:hypothetical protein
VKLQAIKVHMLENQLDLGFSRIDEQANDIHKHRQGLADGTCLFGRKRTGTAWVEHQTDGIGP